MSNLKGYIGALTYSIIVGLSFLITKLTVPHASAILILAHRFSIAFIVYIVFLMIRKPDLPITLKKIVYSLPLTIFYPILFFTLQVFGLKTTSSSNAGIINATVPIITIILVALLGKKPSKIQFISVLLSVSGVLVIFSNNISSADSNIVGMALLFISAFSFSVYSILVKKILKTINVYELTLMIITSGFIIFNILYLFENGINDSINNYFIPFENLQYLLGIFYLGAFASVGTSFASNYSLQTLSAPQFSVFSNLSTLISIIAGVVILNELFTIHYFIGSVLIILGVLGTNFSNIIANKLRSK